MYHLCKGSMVRNLWAPRILFYDHSFDEFSVGLSYHMKGEIIFALVSFFNPILWLCLFLLVKSRIFQTLLISCSLEMN